MNLQTLQKKLKEIEAMGFVETHRLSDTGIGKTLEDLLGIKKIISLFLILEKLPN